MFADTITISVNAVNKVLNRINDSDPYSSEYYLRSTTDEFRLFIRNSKVTDKKRPGAFMDQHNVELIHTVYPVAPATLSTVRRVFTTFLNQQGDTLTDPNYVVTGLLAWLTASSSANIGKLLNFES
ncbi:coat protein [ssRNA phage Esthiorhiza.2_33]|uniref:Coat protein n=2 Tax=Leviviricetes TaxID=2842243 RepID=A0A8S5L494_9VIRU|nr:coat protein [ssRNA phage Esthiorhiza.2_33]QDH91304.1 MAG: hypothetical protein H2RhizoLitter491933_000002 [Leviviridae sp.]DAD52236.1 TPA_asm: coat protein [ssRNA phage Esthiorhiza.2_33]